MFIENWIQILLNDTFVSQSHWVFFDNAQKKIKKICETCANTLKNRPINRYFFTTT